MFCVTVALSYFYERADRQQKNIYLRAVLAALILLIPSGMAGMRALSVGTDLSRYVEPTYRYAVESTSYSGMVETIRGSYLGNLEPAYLLLIFLVSRLSADVHLFLFVISFIITLSIFLALRKMKDCCSLWIGEMVYMTLIYNESLNIMRQCIALSLYLLAYACFVKREYIKTVLLVVLCYLFHRSSAIIVPIMVLWVLYSDWEGGRLAPKKEWVRPAMVGGIILLFLIGLTIFQPLCAWLWDRGLLPGKYYMFIKETPGGFLPPMVHVIYGWGYICAFVAVRKIKNRDLFIVLAAADVIFYTLQTRMPYLYRIALYFLYFRVFLYSQLQAQLAGRLYREARSLSLGRVREFLRHPVTGLRVLYGNVCLTAVCSADTDYVVDLCEIGIFASSLLFWLFFSVHWNNNETMPYMFMTRG